MRQPLVCYHTDITDFLFSSAGVHGNSKHKRQEEESEQPKEKLSHTSVPESDLQIQFI